MIVLVALLLAPLLMLFIAAPIVARNSDGQGSTDPEDLITFADIGRQEAQNK